MKNIFHSKKHLGYASAVCLVCVVFGSSKSASAAPCDPCGVPGSCSSAAICNFPVVIGPDLKPVIGPDGQPIERYETGRCAKDVNPRNEPEEIILCLACGAECAAKFATVTTTPSRCQVVCQQPGMNPYFGAGNCEVKAYEYLEGDCPGY